MKWILGLFGIVAGFIILTPVIIYFYHFHGTISDNPSEWENFGSYLGGIYGSFLGFISTGLIVWTFQTQMKDSRLRNQQDTFFKLLDMFRDTVSEIHHKNQFGVRGLRLLYIEWLNQIKPLAGKRRNKTLQVEDVKKEYEAFYIKNRNTVGHYFRILYHIVKYIDKSNLDEEDKKQYIAFLRSKLSQVQLQLLFFNCLFGQGEDKFKPLIEKYSLFNNLDIDNTQLTIKYFKNKYADGAFR